MLYVFPLEQQLGKMMKKVSTIFPVVSKEMHAARSLVSNLIDDERAAARKEAKAKADKAKSERILEENARYNEIRKRKRDEAKAAGLLVDPVLDAIDNIFLEVAEPEIVDKKVRVQFSRPKNWTVIAEFYGQWGKSKTLMAFKEEFEGRSDRSADQALRQWLVDLRSKKLNIVSNRAQAYGSAIDNLLLAETKTRIAAGLPTDDTTLRFVLVGLLESHGKSDLLAENGGKNSFQHGWACRFWKRHNLVSRAVTTKSPFGSTEKLCISPISLYFCNAEYFGLFSCVRHTEKNSVSVKMQSFAYSTFYCISIYAVFS